LFFKETNIKNSHSEFITVFISEVLKESKHEIKSLDAIAVSMGPGSYTGLRIGVSVAKGLCYALNIPLIAINTLKSMASGARLQLNNNKYDKEILLLPLIDARRMEVYSAIFDMNLNVIRATKAEIINENSFQEYGPDHLLFVFGNGSSKCKEIFASRSNLNIIDEFSPSARFMSALAYQAFNKEIFENTAYFEPYYLKDFIAGKPNVKGLK
jgi:tRNA threonylcarbamoyladenosine biosynthesis protein TsaB